MRYHAIYETKDDYRDVENLTREAFWNVYRPGCMKRYVLHCYRDDTAFVPNMTFSPISIAPAYKRQGSGNL